jgi:hypothetical protein
MRWGKKQTHNEKPKKRKIINGWMKLFLFFPLGLFVPISGFIQHV